MSLPVYSRACLSRTVTLVVALSLTAVSTGAVARELRAAHPAGEAVDRGHVSAALIGTCVPAVDIVADAAPVSHRQTSGNGYGSARFEAAVAAIDAGDAARAHDGAADRTNSQAGVN
jgi:hypothetical protein